MCRQTAMISTHPMTDDEHGGDALLSDESTIELVLKARDGDRGAVQALLQRCLPEVRRWAHGRLPAHARDALDTGDLVQEAALRLPKRVDEFEPRHVEAMQAQPEAVDHQPHSRRNPACRPAPGAGGARRRSSGNAPSPLEMTIQHESHERYRNALGRLSTRDREWWLRGWKRSGASRRSPSGSAFPPPMRRAWRSTARSRSSLESSPRTQRRHKREGDTHNDQHGSNQRPRRRPLAKEDESQHERDCRREDRDEAETRHAPGLQHREYTRNASTVPASAR